MSYFADLDSKRFSFVSKAMGMNEQTFAVINFKGYESISKPYEFDILLVSNEMELDLGDVLNSSAQFLIHRGGDAGKDNVLFNGVLASFEQLQEFNGNVIYRAKLVPKLWWLSLTKHNQVFLDDNVPELVRLCLEDADLLPSDYDFSGITGDYQPHEYVCQYGETHFTFVSRWLEREGIYYYFSQEDDGEIIQFSDANTTAETLDDADLFYSPESGLESTHLSEVIRALTCRQKQLPKEVILKDYNYEKPSLDVTGRAAVDPEKGRGNHYVYGEHFPTPEEGDRLALIRAEELLCQQKEFYGESTVPFMNPGYTFNLLNHYRGDYNQEYLVLEVTHEGSQTACLTPEIVGGLDKPDEKVAYANSFKAIPSITQFRPERTTERPRISGTLNAKIDSEGDGEYAELDEQGRYKVKLPFDVNDQVMNGKASARVRMMQPYAGKNKGMQFPLNKGTEVLLSFIDGHPDRPIIAGAVNNPETPGVVNADNQTESVIQSGSSNKIRMEDKHGKERVMIESPASNSWVRVGSTNDPISLIGESPMILHVGDTYTDPQATSLDSTITGSPSVSNPFNGSEIKNSSGTVVSSIDTSTPGEFYVKYENSNNSSDQAYRKVIVQGDEASESTATSCDGIRIQTAGDLWLEAKGRFGDYKFGHKPLPAAENFVAQKSGRSTTETMLLNFGVNYDPTGAIPYNEESLSVNTFTNVVNQAHVVVSSLDTVTTQEGNIYDFGGYWNYNLGNSYTENFMGQDKEVELNNAALPNDLASKGGPTPGTIYRNYIFLEGKHEHITAVGPFTTALAFPEDLNDDTWIEKTNGGASYDYENNKIGIEVSNSCKYITHTFDKKSEDFVYASSGQLTSYEYSRDGITTEKKWTSAGTKILESTSGGGNSDEKKFDRNTGDLFSHEISSTTGMGTASFAFNFANTASCNISAGTSIEINADASTKVVLNTYATLAAEFTLGMGLSMDCSATAAGWMGLIQGKFDYMLPGVHLEKDSEMKANKKMSAIVNSITEINQNQLQLGWGNVAVFKSSINVSMTMSVCL